MAHKTCSISAEHESIQGDGDNGYGTEKKKRKTRVDSHVRLKRLAQIKEKMGCKEGVGSDLWHIRRDNCLTHAYVSGIASLCYRAK